MHFVVAFDESIGLKYAFGSVEIEAATLPSLVTFLDGPLELVVPIVRHYLPSLILYANNVYVNTVYRAR